jgi:hypothetical protein
MEVRAILGSTWKSLWELQPSLHLRFTTCHKGVAQAGLINPIWMSKKHNSWRLGFSDTAIL